MLLPAVFREMFELGKCEQHPHQSYDIAEVAKGP